MSPEGGGRPPKSRPHWGFRVGTSWTTGRRHVVETPIAVHGVFMTPLGWGWALFV